MVNYGLDKSNARKVLNFKAIRTRLNMLNMKIGKSFQKQN